MNKKLIPEFEEKHLNKVTEKYIKNSTRATELKDVRKYLKDYLTRNNCTKKVKDFIELYLENIALLKKTEIVSDGSYRNCVILIKPYEFCVTHSAGYYKINPDYTMTELLQYFLDNSTKVFLNMSRITKEEEYELWRDWDDMMNL